MLNASVSLTFNKTASRIIRAAAFSSSSSSASSSSSSSLRFLDRSHAPLLYAPLPSTTPSSSSSSIISTPDVARRFSTPDVARRFSTAPVLRLKEIVETVGAEGETTVEGVRLDVPRGRVLRIQDGDGTDRSIFDDDEFWSLLSHTDVLILRQFLNSDYTVLPIEVTGLKYHQQKRLTTLVRKAQRANLIPLKVKELKDTVPFSSELKYGPYDHTKYNSYYDEWDELY